MRIFDKLFKGEKEVSMKRTVSERRIVQDLSSWVRESLRVSPDNQRLAYVAIVSNQMFAVVDGQEGKRYDGIFPPVFSPDSQRVAYVAIVSNQMFVVVDGKEEKRYDGIGEGTLIFSPDSQRVAYVAGVGNKLSVVVDGKEEKRCDGIGEGTLTFSPDSQRVAYVAGVGNKWSVVVDGQEGNQYDGVIVLGGGRIIFDSPDSLHYFAVKGASIHLVEERIE